jgi:ribosomal protein S18 acetylase RimI-like enzyme
MQILPMNAGHLSAAAEIFARNFQKQRQLVPSLPDRFENPEEVSLRLSRMLQDHSGIAAVCGDQLAGYLMWFSIDNFRNAKRRAAYCPVWAHGAAAGQEKAAYQALYRAASAQWAADGCEVHAITLLSGEKATVDTWFWSGFGLAVVDAVRPIAPLAAAVPAGVILRKADGSDAHFLADLEAEHWRHYLEAPIFMNPSPPSTAVEFVELINTPGSSAWLAFTENRPVGYLRLEPSSQGASEVVAADTTVSITGAYVTPQQRGRKIAPALLDAALKDYAAQGYQACSVDFESFNPEAASFWTRYFEPVCYSLMRIPER